MGNSVNCGNFCGGMLIPIQRRICNCNNVDESNGIIYEGIEDMTDIPLNKTSQDAIQQKYVFIDSYNAQNNFFAFLKKIVKLQRSIKSFLRQPKERKKRRKQSNDINKGNNDDEVSLAQYIKNTHSSFSHLSFSMRSDGKCIDNNHRGYFLKKSRKFKYQGYTVNGKKDGFGKVVWDDNSILLAKFHQNSANGICSFKEAINGEFEGFYVHNHPSGYGVYKNEGVALEGEWKNNIINGIGMEFSDEGSYYQGTFENSLKEGIGSFRWSDKTVYQGEWKSNEMVGLGIIRYSDQRVYFGSIKGGLMHGFGEFIWPNGKRYCGQYHFDKKHGFGIHIWAQNPFQAYIGFWNKGKQNGIGIKISNEQFKYGFWNNNEKELWFKGPWEFRKYGKLNESKYVPFLEQQQSAIMHFINNLIKFDIDL